MWIDVHVSERVIVTVNGRPARYLKPGRHWLWYPFSKVDLRRYPLAMITADFEAEELALVPPDEIATVDVSETQRAIVRRRRKAVAWLRPGRHFVWTAEKRRQVTPNGIPELVNEIELELVDVSAIEAPILTEDVQAVVSELDYAQVTAASGFAVLRWIDGVVQTALPAGRHAAWTAARKVHFTTLEVRERTLEVSGQEVMTKDRVSLRMNLAAVFAVSDPMRVAIVARSPEELLYLAVQMATRELVASKTLDELLQQREGVGTELMTHVRPVAEGLGLALRTLGLKDLILPGEMRTLLNRVIEAQKEAEANVILRREETAAVRSMANTAKVLAESPTLMRLKELEAYKELAGKVGQLHVVVGDGGLDRLKLDLGKA